ncbi:MAG: GNAT family N-acetyltransferase [Rhizobiaceae bacterium]|nr:GNAT family N-acetyltransferase [Rhizobiaceae bacterium]
MPDVDPSRVIETPRLLLRPYGRADFDDYVRLWSDPVVTRFIGGQPFTREQSWTRFLRHPGMWAFLGFGSFAAYDRQSGRHIGEAGFHDMMRDLEPSIQGTMETGWAFLPEAHGKGIATEAVRAVLDWADANQPATRVTCFIDTGNPASLRIAEKAGFREFARGAYQGKPVILFERARP